MYKIEGRVNTPRLGLSVVVPCYNSEQWILETVSDLLSKLHLLAPKSLSFEVIVVNDGSTDNSATEIDRISSSEVKAVTQTNQGRFLARLSGAKIALYSKILFLDSRVRFNDSDVEFLVRQCLEQHSGTWIADAIVIDTGIPYGSFWRIIEKFFWNEYYRNNKEIRISSENFDYVPKGTTAILTDRDLYTAVCYRIIRKEYVGLTSNDDTKLLRMLCQETSLRMSPDFRCRYFARSNVRQIALHVFHRGKVLIDGHFRRDSRFFPMIIGYLFAIPIAFWIFYLAPNLMLSILIILQVLLVMVTSWKQRLRPKVSFFFFVFLPFFGIVYSTGMFIGLMKLVLRKAQRIVVATPTNCLF